MENWINAGVTQTLQKDKAKVIKGGIVVFYHENQFYAVDNRCPHMGFPLHMGSLCEGILTCHWHHARFDVCSGGTLDPWADDVPSYEIIVEKNEVWVNPQPKQSNHIEQFKERLLKGLEQNISLVIAKAVVGLIEANASDEDIIKIGVNFGTTERRSGWGSGLTILTAMANILPKLDKQGRILALFQGLVHVARDCAGSPSRHLLGPLPSFDANHTAKLHTWYRNCIEVRDTQGAERVLLTAIQNQMGHADLSTMMMTAATDHFFLDGGHTLDFHNKAFEVLKHTGEEMTTQVLSSITPILANANRSEERHSWQSPINLVSPLNEAFKTLASATINTTNKNFDQTDLLEKLLGDKPLDTIQALTHALLDGVSSIRIAQIVALAAAERIVRFHTQNDFGDWITALHTFTHAHAVHESLLRSNHPLLVRAIFHAAVSIYLDRFLNIPSAKKPVPLKHGKAAAAQNTTDLLHILDKQQQVDEAAQWVIDYLYLDGNINNLFNILGHALLREDANFHSYQMYEAACIEYDHWAQEKGPFAEQAKETMVIAITRYLAAHAPTSREIPHTAKIAWRLHRGEKLFDE